MKQEISLEEILSYDPEKTYIGRGYLDDVYHLENFIFSFEERPRISATLSFPHSFLGQTPSGFHFSAMNMQVLLPYLCEELTKAVLAGEQTSLSSFIPQGSQEKYTHYLTTPTAIKCEVELQEQDQSGQYSFRYSIGTAEKICFEGTFGAKVEYNQISALHSFPDQVEFQCRDRYELKKIWMDEQTLTLDAIMYNPHETLTPVQAHGAIAQSMRVLYCQLFGLRRDEIMLARAYQVNRTYHTPTKEHGDLALQLLPSPEITVTTRHGVRWAMTGCKYTFTEGYVSGTMQVAYPFDALHKEQQGVLRQKCRVTYT